MANKKLVSIGVAVIIVLAVLYLGNKALTTTPRSGAQQLTQYKVVSPVQAACSGPDTCAAAVGAQLNQYAAGGWTFVAELNNGSYWLFGK